MDEIEINGVRIAIVDEHEEIIEAPPADEEIIFVTMYGDLLVRPIERD